MGNSNSNVVGEAPAWCCDADLVRCVFRALRAAGEEDSVRACACVCRSWAACLRQEGAVRTSARARQPCVALADPCRFAKTVAAYDAWRVCIARIGTAQDLEGKLRLHLAQRCATEGGVPPPLRHKLWPLFCGTRASAIYDPELYANLELDKSTCQRAIDADTPRIMCLASETECDNFKHVLLAYSVHDTAVGYTCCGSAWIVSFLLYYLKEEETFWVLERLMNHPRYDLRSFVTHTGVSPFVSFQKVLFRLDDQLATHLAGLDPLDLTPSCSDVLIRYGTLFTKDMPHIYAARILDLVLLCGMNVWHATTLTLLQENRGWPYTLLPSHIPSCHHGSHLPLGAALYHDDDSKSVSQT
eukprot:TRINITY_DN5783_c0_g1_i1.p1 TRINITY_DN5783_c0_g1~~TRINITY_DN5783_c0_g1_i1.p1  ORF type:complete len:378 (-),score=51.97 TRINITY_DN5783_c0_g1_i1:125-1195(-)